MQIGEIIRFLRTYNKMSQSEVAEKLDVRVMNISNWERGISQPPAEKIMAFSHLFHVSIDTLFGRTTLDSFSNQNIYAIRDLALELQTVMNDLAREDIDSIFRYVYELRIKSLRKQFSYDTFELEKSIDQLLLQENCAVHELALYCQRLLSEFGMIHSKQQQQLLFDSYLLIELKQENSPEFLSTQRGIYEELLPLDLFIISCRKGDRTLKEMADRFNISHAFIQEAVHYYTISKGNCCFVNEYQIDLNQILATDTLAISRNRETELSPKKTPSRQASKLTEAALLNKIPTQ